MGIRPRFDDFISEKKPEKIATMAGRTYTLTGGGLNGVKFAARGSVF